MAQQEYTGTFSLLCSICCSLCQWGCLWDPPSCARQQRQTNEEISVPQPTWVVREQWLIPPPMFIFHADLIVCPLLQGKRPGQTQFFSYYKCYVVSPKSLALFIGISWNARGNLPTCWPHLFLINISYGLERERNKFLWIQGIMAHCSGLQSCRGRTSDSRDSDRVKPAVIGCHIESQRTELWISDWEALQEKVHGPLTSGLQSRPGRGLLAQEAPCSMNEAANTLWWSHMWASAGLHSCISLLPRMTSELNTLYWFDLE